MQAFYQAGILFLESLFRSVYRESVKKDQGSYNFDDAVQLLRRLRSKEGCPWNRQQDFHSLKPFLKEEAYELLEALTPFTQAENQTGQKPNQEDYKRLCEELGDLLLQILFLGILGEEQGGFQVKTIASTLCEKLIRRHPHVFGGSPKAKTPKEVSQLWERIKAQERQENTEKAQTPKKGILGGIPRQMPALEQAQRICLKASAAGFEWSQIQEILKKLDEEIGEFKKLSKPSRSHPENSSSVRKHQKHEIGDILFTLANLAQFLEISGEEALHECLDRFQNRFSFMERRLRQNHQSLEDAQRDQLEELWQQAKKELEGNT